MRRAAWLLCLAALLASGAEAQTVSTPALYPANGTQFANGQIITIISSTSGATLCYTIDGSTPAAATAGTCSHGTSLANNGAVNITVSETVKVLGTLSGDTNSAVASAAYTVGGGVTSNIDDIFPTSSASPAIGWATPPYLDTGCGAFPATSYPHTIVTSPSLDGFSSLLTINGPPETCVGWFYNAGPQDTNNTTITNDFEYESGSTNSTGNANEFDVYLYEFAASNPTCLAHNTDFYFGTQCVTSTSNLQIWDESGTGWHDTSPTINCASAFASGTGFHHVTMNDYWTCGDTSGVGGYPHQCYQSIVIDGVTHPINTCYSSMALPGGYSENSGQNFELDIGSAGTSLSANLDEVNLTFAGSSSHTCAQCYISPTGSDSNTGASKTTAWLHAPGMRSATGNAASQVPLAGDSYIFEGGGTWHFGNSGLTPYAGTCSGNNCWPWSWSGSSVSPIYIGVDKTWFTGSSWVRPIFSGDNPITNSQPSSCTGFDFASNNPSGGGYNAVYIGTSTYVHLDNIEMSGFCVNTAGDIESGMVNQGGIGDTVSNMYFHGYTLGTSATDDEFYAIQGGGASGWKTQLSNQCYSNVFDNSDGTFGNVGAWPNQTGASPVPSATMGAIQNTCAEVYNNVANRIDNFIVGTSSIVHDNLIHDLYEPPTANHGNIWNSNNTPGGGTGATCTITGNVQEFYNNVVYNINEGVGVWMEPCGSQGYIFNNVMWSVFNGVNAYLIGTGTSYAAATIYFYNNTTDYYLDLNNLFPQLSGAHNGSDPTFKGTVHFSNNQWVGAYTGISSGGVPFANCESGATCTFTDDTPSNELFQTETVANGQGYTKANFYSPINTSGSTVGAGANQSSLCPTFSSDSFLCSGIVSVTEATGSGGMISSSPAFTPVARGTHWDIAAHQFPATLTLTMNNSTGGTVTSSPSGISCTTGITCTASFAGGTVVTLSESPNTGYGFAQWLGACTGNTSCSVTMSSNQTVSAGFFYTYPGVVNNNTGIITGNSLPTGLPGTGTGIAIPFAPALGNFVINSTAFGSINATSNCITNLWDFNSSAAASTGNITNSGGVADIMASLHTNYIAIGAPGGVDRPISVNTSGNCAQINNTNEPYSTTASGVYPNTNFNILGGFAFSRVTDNKFVWLDEHPCVASCAGITNTSTSAFTILYSGSITCTGAACLNPIPYTGSFVADFRLCPGIGSVGAGISSSTLVETDGDEYYAAAISFTGIQGTGIYVFVFSPTLGCETLNTATGNIYTWCAPSTSCATASPIGQETTCYGAVSPNGIHDIQGRGDSYLAISQAGSGWTNCSSLGQHSVLWRFTDTAVCNTSPCPGGFGTTVQNVSVTAGGHDAVGDLNLIKENDPNPNYRPLSNTSSFTQFASINAGTHTTIAADLSGQDLGAVMEFIQGATGVGNTGWGWDNPQALAFENELTAFPGWQDFTYTGTNLPISRFVSNYDAANIEVLASSGTPITVSATSTIATYAIAHPFPACLSGGSTCGALQVAVTNCTNTQFNQTANLATVNYSGANPVSFTINGTYTPQSATADTTCKVIGNSPNFGSANGIGYISQDQSWAVMGYNGFCQLGADSSNQCFSGAIMVRLNVLGAVSPFFKWGANPNSGTFEIKWR